MSIEGKGLMTVLEEEPPKTADGEAGMSADEEGFRHRILMDQCRDGVVILDLSGAVLEANRSFAQMLRCSPQEVLSLHVWDWNAFWTREELLKLLQRLGNESETFETRHRRRDGSIYDAEVSVSSATWKGQTLLYCVTRDISRRKAMEKIAPRSPG